MAHRDSRGLPEGQLGSPINCVLSASSGSYTNATSTPTTVVSLNIFASGDYPITLRLMGDGSGNAGTVGVTTTNGTRTSVTATLYLYRDNVLIDYVTTNIAAANPGSGIQVFDIPSSYFFMDFPSKGNHTYTLQAWSQASGGYTQTITAVKLLAYEDRSLIYK